MGHGRPGISPLALIVKAVKQGQIPCHVGGADDGNGYLLGGRKGAGRLVDEDGGGVDGDEDGARPDGEVAWRQTGPLVELSWMWLIEASHLDEEDYGNDDNDNDDDDDDDSSASEGGARSKHTTEPSADELLPERVLIRAVNSRLEIKLRSNGTGEREVDTDVNNKGLEEYLACIIASKALVVCHLYIICHLFVDEAVWWLMG